jgi:hypothetical protein
MFPNNHIRKMDVAAAIVRFVHNFVKANITIFVLLT